MVEKKTEVKEEVKPDFQLVQVATQTGWVVQDSNGNQLTEMQLLVEIGNDLKEVKRSLLG